jgi:AraC family transcriptional regulator, regulatory protein of adaptative response / DNA-3-methyladenine glycosylase II
MIEINGRFDWASALAFFARRAVDGVEQVEAGTYRRAVRFGDSVRVLSISFVASKNALDVALAGAPLPDDMAARARRMFDTDADVAAINAHLSADPFLAGSVAAHPAVRVAGGWDPFEIAIRTVVGQQVSVVRARQLNGVLVERCCRVARRRRSADPELLQSGLRCAFPTAEEVLAADLTSLGMPGARVQTLRAVAEAALEQPDLFGRGVTLDETITRLRSVRGIGEWTAHYIAMRACREADAFPASDVGLLRGAADAEGRRPSAAALLARAEEWRPWRAYAAHHLWAADSTARVGVPREGVNATLHS